MKSRPFQSRQAFTLTELLISIAIIGLLAGLIAGGIFVARRKAHRIQCANNLRQLGLALHQFINDNRTYPLWGNPGFGSGEFLEHHTTWLSALQREAISDNIGGSRTWLNKGVWHCPAAKRPSTFPPEAGYDDYGYNGFGLGKSQDEVSLGLGGHNRPNRGGIYAPPISENEIANPSSMLALGDGFQGWNGVIRDGGALLWRTPAVEEYFGSTKRSNQRHERSANVFFCDGHVELLSLKSLFTDNGDGALRRWNRDNQPHPERTGP